MAVYYCGDVDNLLWYGLMVQEKKPYLDKAVELKAEYEKAMASYNAADAEDEVWLCFLTF